MLAEKYHAFWQRWMRCIAIWPPVTSTTIQRRHSRHVLLFCHWGSYSSTIVVPQTHQWDFKRIMTQKRSAILFVSSFSSSLYHTQTGTDILLRVEYESSEAVPRSPEYVYLLNLNAHTHTHMHKRMAIQSNVQVYACRWHRHYNNQQLPTSGVVGC